MCPSPGRSPCPPSTKDCRERLGSKPESERLGNQFGAELPWLISYSMHLKKRHSNHSFDIHSSRRTKLLSSYDVHPFGNRAARPALEGHQRELEQLNRLQHRTQDPMEPIWNVSPRLPVCNVFCFCGRSLIFAAVSRIFADVSWPHFRAPHRTRIGSEPCSLHTAGS